MQRLCIRERFSRGAQIGGSDDFKQRDSRAVQIHSAAICARFMQRFPGIFLKMRARNAYRFLIRLLFRRSPRRNFNRQRAILYNGLVMLADLITLRGAILALIARPNRIARSTAPRFATGSTPGSARSTTDACIFGSAPKRVEAPENSFETVDN